MAPSITTLVYARTLPLLRLPLLLNDVIGLPLCIIGNDVPGIVLITLSMSVAIIDILVSLRAIKTLRTPVEQSELHVDILRITADAGMACGLLIAWIISLVTALNGFYRNDVGRIATFCVFLAWLSHTTSLLAQLYFCMYATKKQHVCQHCGHKAKSPISDLRSIVGLEAPARASDETCYDENEDGEDAAMLKDEEV